MGTHTSLATWCPSRGCTWFKVTLHVFYMYSLWRFFLCHRAHSDRMPGGCSILEKMSRWSALHRYLLGECDSSRTGVGNGERGRERERYTERDRFPLLAYTHIHSPYRYSLLTNKLSQNIMYDKHDSVSHIYLIFKWVHAQNRLAEVRDADGG